MLPAHTGLWPDSWCLTALLLLSSCPASARVLPLISSPEETLVICQLRPHILGKPFLLPGERVHLDARDIDVLKQDVHGLEQGQEDRLRDSGGEGGKDGLQGNLLSALSFFGDLIARFSCLPLSPKLDNCCF